MKRARNSDSKTHVSTKASEHVNLITMMARLTTEEESNQVAVLMKELQYLKEEASDLRSATSRLKKSEF